MAGIQIDLNKLDEIIRYASLASDEIDQAQRALNKIGTNGIWKVNQSRQINDSLSRLKSKTNTTRGRIENFEEAVRNGKNEITTYFRTLPQKSAALDELISAGIIVTHTPAATVGNVGGIIGQIGSGISGIWSSIGGGGISGGVNQWVGTINSVIQQHIPSEIIGTTSFNDYLQMLHDIPLIPFNAVNRG